MHQYNYNSDHRNRDILSSCLLPPLTRGNRIDGASVARHRDLQKEVSHLTEAEDKLDELITKCNLQLRLLTEDSQNKKYPFTRKGMRVCVTSVCVYLVVTVGVSMHILYLWVIALPQCLSLTPHHAGLC